MNNKTTSIQRIDWVLEWFATSDLVKNGCDFDFTYDKITKVHPELIEEGDWGVEQIKILRKLEKDGYINVIISVPPDYLPLGVVIGSIPTQYSISFEGDVFYQQGGYDKEIKRNELNENRLKQNLLLTKVLAAGVVIPSIYYIDELASELTKGNPWIGGTLYFLSVGVAFFAFAKIIRLK